MTIMWAVRIPFIFHVQMLLMRSVFEVYSTGLWLNAIVRDIITPKSGSPKRCSVGSPEQILSISKLLFC